MITIDSYTKFTESLKETGVLYNTLKAAALV